eukprot:6388047-Amphidinium_carterae.1
MNFSCSDQSSSAMRQCAIIKRYSNYNNRNSPMQSFKPWFGRRCLSTQQVFDLVLVVVSLPCGRVKRDRMHKAAVPLHLRL